VSGFEGSYKISDGVMQFFITGTDSPVSILSFTKQLPVKRIISQGIIVYSGTIITSPGTRSPLLI
jgi:hypothetical protein